MSCAPPTTVVPAAFVEPCSPEPTAVESRPKSDPDPETAAAATTNDSGKVDDDDAASSVPYYDLKLKKLVVKNRPSMAAVGAAMQALLEETPDDPEMKGALNDEKHAEAAAAPAPEALGPWFDSSPHDAKTTVKEVGAILRAFEDSLWNHGGDFNAIESEHLWKVIVHVRTLLSDLEKLILQPRFARNQWMPSLALTNGMKQCFDRLAARRDVLVRSKLDESIKAAAIIDEAGKIIGKLMGEAMAMTAKAVGIDYFKEIAATERRATEEEKSRKARNSEPDSKKAPAAPTRGRRNRRKKKGG